MTVFAIDPGPEQSAFVFWNGEAVLGKGLVPSGEMFGWIRSSGAEHLAIEMIESFGMAVGRETFRTVLWIGEYRRYWICCGLPESGVDLIGRIPIKVHLCKSARAKDGNVRQALIDRFGPPGVKANKGVLYGVTSHCWSALAVAVTAHDRLTGKV